MVADYYLPVPLLTMLRCQKWDDVLRLPEPKPTRYVGDALWHFGRAVALAKKGDLEAAHAEQRIFEQLGSRLPKDSIWMFNPGDKLLAAASLVLSARLAPDAAQAIPIRRQAVQSPG